MDTLAEQLSERAMELGIWTLTACRFLICALDDHATRFLTKILSQPIPETALVTIDHLFCSILQVIFTEPLSKLDLGWKALLKALMQAQLPPSISTSHALRLLSTPSGSQPINMLYKAGCITDIPDDSGLAIAKLHPAFKAFITDRHRCTDDRFYVHTAVDCNTVTEVCFLIMNHLSHHMCLIMHASLLDPKLAEKEQHVMEFVTGPLKYASQESGSTTF